jgi:BirA family transcriptional regulator, biotin operon repressor / biotin---[acetyl-CoA-carboxylase] ligase
MTEEQKIAEKLETEYMGRSLFYFERLNSTNNFLKNAAKELPNGCAAITLEQFAGKGRRGNKWIAEKGQMLAVSVLIKHRLNAAAPPVTLMFGLSAAKALSGLFGRDFLIKWPNDIVCDGKKICGILCETKISSEGCSTVCGIGVNLLQTENFFEESGIPHGASIKMLTGITPQPDQVAAAILNRFEKTYAEFSQGQESTNSVFFEAYNALCVTLGKEIKAQTADGEILGFAKAVNSDGSLQVECEGKTVNLIAGEVSVRGVMGYV